MNSSHRFNDLVTTAEKDNHAQGYPDGNFRPGNTVNSAEAVKLLLDTAGLAPEVAKVQIQPDVCPDVKGKKGSAVVYSLLPVRKNIGLIAANENCQADKS